jgi:hypothetical protein
VFQPLVIALYAGIYDAVRTLAAVTPDTSPTVDNGEVVSMRPYIICHMVTSIDGRLHPSRFTVPAAGIPAEVLRGHYKQVTGRFGSEGWIVGRKTMAEMAKGSERPMGDVPQVARGPHVANRNGRDLAIDPAGRPGPPWEGYRRR